MLIWLNQRSVSAVLFALSYYHSLHSTFKHPSTQITKVSENLNMNWRPNKHKLPRSKILLLKILSILSYSKTNNNKHLVPTWYSKILSIWTNLLKTQCWGYLALMTIEVGMEFKKTFCSVCTVTEIPFFDELPKEENHSFLSLIYYKERYYLFSSTFNVLCWTIVFNVSITSFNVWSGLPFQKLWDLMTCICT